MVGVLVGRMRWLLLGSLTLQRSSIVARRVKVEKKRKDL